MKAIKRIALLLIAVFVITPVVLAQAGTVEKNVSMIVDGQLNSTDWFDAEDSTYAEDGKLVLPFDPTISTRVISKMIVQQDPVNEVMLAVNAKLQINRLAENDKFIFAMGLDSIEALSGEAGNIEIEITNKSGLQLSLVAYDENGTPETLVAPKAVGISLDKDFTLAVVATSDNQVKVSVNGKVVCTATVQSNLEGRIGFLQSGACGVKITSCEASFTKYERPENPNISEDFEREIFNKNWFTTNFISSVRYPAYVAVESFNGNNVLMFHNAKLTYFGTKYAYSNFELTFDVPYYLRNMIKDENGYLLAAPTAEFLVSVGDDAVDFNGFGYDTSTEAIRFTKDTVHGMNHTPEKFRANYGSKGYFDMSSNEGFSVLVRMVNGYLEVGIKALDGDKYDILAKTYYEDFRTGYVKIWSVNDANFAIDNFKITNLDDKGNVIDAGFQGATIIQDDFDYVPAEPVFRPTEGAKAEAKTDWTPVLYTAISCAGLLLVSVIVKAFLTKKAKKEAA